MDELSVRAVKYLIDEVVNDAVILTHLNFVPVTCLTDKLCLLLESGVRTRTRTSVKFSSSGQNLTEFDSSL